MEQIPGVTSQQALQPTQGRRFFSYAWMTRHSSTPSRRVWMAARAPRYCPFGPPPPTSGQRTVRETYWARCWRLWAAGISRTEARRHGRARSRKVDCRMRLQADCHRQRIETVGFYKKLGYNSSGEKNAPIRCLRMHPDDEIVITLYLYAFPTHSASFPSLASSAVSFILKFG